MPFALKTREGGKNISAWVIERVSRRHYFPNHFLALFWFLSTPNRSDFSSPGPFVRFDRKKTSVPRKIRLELELFPERANFRPREASKSPLPSNRMLNNPVITPRHGVGEVFRPTKANAVFRIRPSQKLVCVVDSPPSPNLAIFRSLYSRDFRRWIHSALAADQEIVPTTDRSTEARQQRRRGKATTHSRWKFAKDCPSAGSRLRVRPTSNFPV